MPAPAPDSHGPAASHTLHYLGEHPGLPSLEEEYHRQRGSSDTYYAYGWTWVKWHITDERPRVMVAWIPSIATAPGAPRGRAEGPCVWPVWQPDAEPEESRPGLLGQSSWEWDGDVERPTLAPSILHPLASGERDALGYRVACHGYVRDGAWHPC